MVPAWALGAAQGRKKRNFVQCTNLHVVSGSPKLYHEIPGKRPDQRIAFKQEMVRRAVDSAFRAAEGAVDEHGDADYMRTWKE